MPREPTIVGATVMTDLRDQFGEIDVYLFDQFLRGRIRPGMRILDAGCGDGRNLVYALRAEHDVFGCDADATAIDAVRRLAARLAPHLPPDHFRVEPIEQMTFPDAHADVVLASAVLHFAADDTQFRAMVNGCWRVLRPGGMLFTRLASSIGTEHLVRQIRGRRFRLPDGSDRYLVDAPLLEAFTAELGGTLVDPLKTTVVQDQRSMTTWVVRKRI